MIFEKPQILYLLILIPLLISLWVWMRIRNRRLLERFADKGMFGRLIPDESRRRPATKMILLMSALACLIVAVANPQVGSRMVKGQKLGSDIAICLDISNSMMAEDLQPNRLERSKRIVNNLLNELGGDRVSLIVFAGSSYIQMPLTNDYSAVKLFMDQISCDLISQQGTAIGDAIEKAMESFGYGDPDREWERSKSRAIVVISDGENHEDDAEEAASKASKEGVIVCTIGMGLPEGVPIPEYVRGQRVGYKKDHNGNTVTTSLNEKMLSDIAEAGNGTYLRAGNINASLSAITNEIESLEKANFGEAMFSEYESRYMYPLVAAIVLMILELMIFERRNKKFNLSKILQKK